MPWLDQWWWVVEALDHLWPSLPQSNQGETFYCTHKKRWESLPCAVSIHVCQTISQYCQNGMPFDGSRHGRPWKILPDATLATEVSRGTSLVYPPWTRTTVFPKSVLMPTMIWFGWKSTITCRNKETRSSSVGYYNLMHFGQSKVSIICCKGWTTC